MRCVCQCHSRPTIRGNKKRENDTTRQDTRKREREQGTVHVIESPFFQETLLQEADHKGRQPQCSLQTKGNQTIWPWRNKGTRISFEHAYQCICPCTDFPNKVVIRPFYCPSNAGLLGHKDKTCKADRVFPRGKKRGLPALQFAPEALFGLAVVLVLFRVRLSRGEIWVGGEGHGGRTVYSAIARGESSCFDDAADKDCGEMQVSGLLLHSTESRRGGGEEESYGQMSPRC